jgi:VanZ family protein
MFFRHTKWAMLWALFILILCGMPGKDIPHISFLELLSFDKLVHAGVFFFQFLLLTRGFLLQSNQKLLHTHPKLVSLLFCIVYGGVLEILQQTIFEDRSASVFDFIANSFGAVIGLVLYSRIEKRVLSRLIK